MSAAAPAGGHRVFRMPFGKVYPLYLAKVDKKGRSRAELDAVIAWLTGYDAAAVAAHCAAGTDIEAFFAGATLPAGFSAVTGVVCGVRVEAVEDPLMRQVRVLDKLVDELAKGRPLARVLRD